MTAMTDQTPAAPALSDFEGERVLGAGIEIPSAAGGLREAMKIEPQEFHGGQRLYVVLECVVDKLRHDPVVADGERVGWRRIHIMAAENATFVDGDLVRTHLEDQAKRLADAREAAKRDQEKDQGVARLPTDEELYAAHKAGEHADGLVPGCVECDGEAAAGASEARADGDGETPPSAPAPLAGRRARGAKKAAGSS